MVKQSRTIEKWLDFFYFNCKNISMEKLSILELESYYNLSEKMLEILYRNMIANPSIVAYKEKYSELFEVVETMRREIHKRIIGLSTNK